MDADKVACHRKMAEKTSFILNKVRRKCDMFKMKSGRKSIFDICEVLSAGILIGNTVILMIFQNVLSYEKIPLLDAQAVSKSSYIVIMQHNPAFAIIYAICGTTMLFCGIYRLVKYIKGEEG